jgi:hypothetical protein
MLDSHDIADVISDLAFDAIEKKVLDQLVIANGDDV